MKEIVNNSEDRKFSNDSDISPENIQVRRPISSESEEDDCSEAESDIQHGTWTKQEQRGLVLVEENG